MWILPMLGVAGAALGFIFLTLAIASGLYYLSELVEEHTVFSKKLLTHLIQSIIAIHVLLMLFDGFPVMLTLFSAASHGVYLANVSRTFPMVRLTDGVFILSCFLVIINHFIWFQYFSNPPLPADHPYNSMPGAKGSPYDYSSAADPYFAGRYPKFHEIAAFFGLCVWLVPFALFVSLSASDNVLPSTNDGVGIGGVGVGGGVGGVDGLGAVGGVTAQGRKKTGQGMAKALFGGVKEWVGTSGEALGVWTADTRHARFE